MINNMKMNHFSQNTDNLPPSSLLDRLCNTLDEMNAKDALMRDLFHLFNTKLPHYDYSEYSELPTSILNYGLPNFAEYEANTKTISDKIRLEILNLIETHEPRLRNVDIQVNHVEKNSITFSIKAVLMNDPEPLSIVFDSKYQPVLQEFNIKDSNRE